MRYRHATQEWGRRTSVASQLSGMASPSQVVEDANCWHLPLALQYCWQVRCANRLPSTRSTCDGSHVRLALQERSQPHTVRGAYLQCLLPVLDRGRNECILQVCFLRSCHRGIDVSPDNLQHRQGSVGLHFDLWRTLLRVAWGATRRARQTLIRMGSNTVVASLRRRSATDAASS